MSLTDEQINDAYGAARVQHDHIPHDDVVRIARAIESATTAPLLERIKELEAERDQWKDDAIHGSNADYLRGRIAELEKQLEAVKVDAGR